MIRKTITIKEDIINSLQSQNITKEYSSFSELVSNALKLLIEKKQKEQYKQALLEASKDELYIQDMKNIEDDFKYSDFESIK